MNRLKVGLFCAALVASAGVLVAASCHGQDFPEDSFAERLNRAVRDEILKTNSRVDSVESQVKALGQRIADLEGRASSATFSVKLHEEDMPWQAQPTPRAEVIRILGILKPLPHETFVDYGCGFDARYLIEAVKRYGCRAVGVEIDPARSASARQYVVDAGLQDKITIMEGDARTVDVSADVGVVYLEPDVLEELRPQLEKLNRFVSYQHAVPGLDMVKGQDTFSWRKPASVVASSMSGRVAVYNGQVYSAPVCNSPTCAMCNAIRSQLRITETNRSAPTTSRTVITTNTPPVVQRTWAATTVDRTTCTRGRCLRCWRRQSR